MTDKLQLPSIIYIYIYIYIYRWTSVQNAFNPKTKFYEIESRERESFKKSEAAPLYSSFSPDKIFKRPTDTRTKYIYIYIYI